MYAATQEDRGFAGWAVSCEGLGRVPTPSAGVPCLPVWGRLPSARMGGGSDRPGDTVSAPTLQSGKGKDYVFTGDRAGEQLHGPAETPSRGWYMAFTRKGRPLQGLQDPAAPTKSTS